jgi:hypothetical protein
MAEKKSKEAKVLESAAKTIGAAAGKVAALAGVKAGAAPRAAGKLPKKNKHRLPRRQKKAQNRLASAL